LLWFFRSLVVKPFNTLLAGTRLVVDENFAHRIDLGTGDELSELAEAMNGMTDRFQRTMDELNATNRDLDQKVQQRTREVIQNEQLASVGFLAAGVAHEINNPLATIAWSAESLVSRVAETTMIPAEDREYDEELCDALQTNLQRIEDEAYRCKGITEKLLDFSRLSEVRRASTDLAELVNDVVTMVTKVGKYKCKTINVHGSESLTADVNPQEIRQVVLNLVTNALESVDTEGAVDVTIGKSDSMASIVVKDNGCGMNQEVLKHLFEPFFTRRRDGTGTGLGLSITYRIISQHGGSLVAHSEGDGRGSEMQIKLPIGPENQISNGNKQQGSIDERYEKV
jgi:two-component system NtrC family sensor kinase